MASVNRGKRLREIPIKTYKSMIERLLLSKSYVDEDGCWIWLGYKNKNGYGSMRYLGLNSLVHRISYKVLVGEFDNEKEVCHKCDVPHCINPNHLFLGTHHENMMDAKRKNRRKGRLSYTDQVGRDHLGRFLKENTNERI